MVVKPERKLRESSVYQQKKPREEEEPSTNNYLLVGLIIGAFVGCFFAFVIAISFGPTIYKRYFGDPQEVNWPPHVVGGIDTRSEHALYNTTTQQGLWNMSQAFKKIFTDNPGRYQCLCLHHLQYPVDSVKRVQVCAIVNDYSHQMYFMRNPRIAGFNKGSEMYEVMERSISCTDGPGNITARKRFTQVFFEWEDEKEITHYALFRNHDAFCLQLALDEFKGNVHCNFEKK